MGRRDAVQTVLEIVAECRRLLPSLIVTWSTGWETRGNGSQANYSFGNVHHTAVASSEARPFPTQSVLEKGRPDLSGPLSQFGGPWCTIARPRLHVICAHPANHAGASRASGPVPKLALYNPLTVGLEIDYSGLTPMSAGQLLVGHVWTRAVANVVAGGNVEHVRGHFETSVTGKIDPAWGGSGKSYDMVAWRRNAAALASTTPAPEGFLDMLDDKQQADLYRWTKQIATELMGPDWVAKGTLGWPVYLAGEDRAKPTARRQTVVAMLAAVYGEQFGTLSRTAAGPAKDTPYGQALTTRVLAEQAVAQAKLAATRKLEVDVAAIDWSKVTVPAKDLSDRDVERIAGRVADLIAARMAS